jgi:hypothetical protein
MAGLRAPAFVLGGPVRFTATVENTGTVHRDLTGASRLLLRAGGAQVGFADVSVLRGATRTVTAIWRRPPLICVCDASVAIRLPDGTISRATARVLIFPIHLVAAVVAAALVLVLVMRLVRIRYRAHVLAAARAMNERDV